MKKHLRIHLDFTIEADEANIQFSPHLSWSDGQSPSDKRWQTYLERQRNLFRIMLSQPTLLQRYLEYLAFSEIASASERSWISALGIDDSTFDAVVLSAVTSLKPSDQKWFNRLAANQLLFDNTEEFQKGFSIVWGDAKFIEVEQDETGDHHEQ